MAVSPQPGVLAHGTNQSQQEGVVEDFEQEIAENAQHEVARQARPMRAPKHVSQRVRQEHIDANHCARRTWSGTTGGLRVTRREANLAITFGSSPRNYELMNVCQFDELFDERFRQNFRKFHPKFADLIILSANV